uniref:EGF-like domain-containing protein n=1 Tax=Magallana gigas TaxID=29159 RepID=A0A8W8NT94_MAGGI|nr:neurogenic locus notch homolog protein 1-like [Crassostrea gigas]
MLSRFTLLMCVVGVLSAELHKGHSKKSLERRGDFFDSKIRMARLSRATPRTISVFISCDPNPCQNGGTCYVYHKSCRCPSGWTGRYCETRQI